MKKIMTLLLLTFFCAASVHAADVKIGYVDLQKALNNCEAGKVAKEKISLKVKEYESQIEKKQTEMKKLKDENLRRARYLARFARLQLISVLNNQPFRNDA
jgi:outer membrane protein